MAKKENKTQGSKKDPGFKPKVTTAPGAKIQVPKNEPGSPQDGKPIKYLVVHCSASNLPSHDNAATIDAWHKERGFKGIGYHYFIQSDGTLETGRPLDDDPVLEREEIGAHTLGVNENSIGVCLSGIDINDFTVAQFKTLEDLITELLSRGIKFEVAGHNFFTDKKDCPCFDWRQWVKSVFPELYPKREFYYK
jgi:N-acetylmuramoyl-L-alanine amidase